MRRWLIATLALLPVACDRLLSPTPNPDGPHTLKAYEHKEGDVYRVTRTEMAEADAAASSNFRTSANRGVAKEKVVFTDEVLARPDGGRTTRLRRTYEVIDRTDLKGAAIKSALVGKTVVVDWTEGKPKFEVDGQPPTAEQKRELEAEFRERKGKTRSPEMLPDRPVKVGETWQIDKTKFTDGLLDVEGVKCDVDHVRVSGKLVSLIQLCGVPRATVEVTVRVPVAEFTVPKSRTFKADDASSLTVTFSVDFCPDGTTPGCQMTHTTRGRVGADLPNNGLFTYHYNESGTYREEPAAKK